jgi:hypothetical protein
MRDDDGTWRVVRVFTDGREATTNGTTTEGGAKDGNLSRSEAPPMRSLSEERLIGRADRR